MPDLSNVAEASFLDYTVGRVLQEAEGLPYSEGLIHQSDVSDLFQAIIDALAVFLENCEVDDLMSGARSPTRRQRAWAYLVMREALPRTRLGGSIGRVRRYRDAMLSVGGTLTTGQFRQLASEASAKV